MVYKPLEIANYIAGGSVGLVIFVAFAYGLGKSLMQTPHFLLSENFFVLRFGLLIIAGAVAKFFISYNKLTTITNPSDIANITVDPSEEIIFFIAGVLRVGSFLDRGFDQPFGCFIPQSGRRVNPMAQNALIASDRRIYFIFAPISLSDQTITRTSDLEFAFAQKYIQQMLNNMIGSTSLQKIYDSNPINFGINISDIKNIIINKSGGVNSQDIKFYDHQGRKLEYQYAMPQTWRGLPYFFTKLALRSRSNGTIHSAAGNVVSEW